MKAVLIPGDGIGKEISKPSLICGAAGGIIKLSAAPFLF